LAIVTKGTENCRGRRHRQLRLQTVEGMMPAAVCDYSPMKAVLVDKPFSDPAWIFERKLDGIRCGVIRRNGKARLVSRSGEVMDRTYPELVDALSVDGPDVVADGEIVAFKGGQTSFERLQGRMGIRDPERARQTGIAVFLYLFDVLCVDGHDVRDRPLRERKRRLREAVRFGGPLRFSTHRVGDGEAYFEHACERGWEGLIAKRSESLYRSTRSRDWLKIKCSHEQELVVGGWTDPKGSRQRFGALLVGYWDGDRLRYAGKVGTGFDGATLERVWKELERLGQRESPFSGQRLPSRAHWVKPELVAQIAFTEWTRDGKLRHPRFLGLRTDKPAREVVRERPS
jgi:bifunctional non-homologous end joining protein LigD